MENNCLIYYSKKGCPPCDFFFQQLTKKYTGCYSKIVMESDDEAFKTVQKFNLKTVPFAVLEGGEVLSTDELIRFIRNIKK